LKIHYNNVLSGYNSVDILQNYLKNTACTSMRNFQLDYCIFELHYLTTY